MKPTELRLTYDNSRDLFYLLKRDKFGDNFNNLGVSYKSINLKDILYHLIRNEEKIIKVDNKSMPKEFRINLEKIALNGNSNYTKKFKKKDGSIQLVKLLVKEVSVEDYINFLYLDQFFSKFLGNNKNL